MERHGSDVQPWNVFSGNELSAHRMVKGRYKWMSGVHGGLSGTVSGVSGPGSFEGVLSPVEGGACCEDRITCQNRRACKNTQRSKWEREEQPMNSALRGATGSRVVATLQEDVPPGRYAGHVVL